MATMYRSEETIKMCEEATKEFETTKFCYGENYITLLHNKNKFGLLTNNEMKQSMKIWKRNGLRCNTYNFKDYSINNRTWYAFVIQICDEEGNITDANPNLCPLSLAYGTMVSGLTYFSKTKLNRELIQKYLGSSN